MVHVGRLGIRCERRIGTRFPEREGIEPEIPGPIIFVEMTIELNVTNPTREGLVTCSSMVISTVAAEIHYGTRNPRTQGKSRRSGRDAAS